MRKIYAIGETTYDIVFRNGQPNRGVVGGSALNTAVSLGRLKLPVHFISRFGNDTIGNLSATFLTGNGVDCSYIARYDGQSRIALAFLDGANNASYQFYHGNKSPRITFPQVKGDDIVHFGSLNALNNKGRKNLLGFLGKASKAGAIVIYDPNIRNVSEADRATIIAKVEENMALSTIVKGSTQDFIRLYGTSNSDTLFQKFSALGVKALFITDGDQPTQLMTNLLEKSYNVEPIEAISTIGAGDNFSAGVIYGLWKNNITSGNINTIEEQVWDGIVAYGHRFAREVCLSEMNYISEGFANKQVPS
jgi:fructokinase